MSKNSGTEVLTDKELDYDQGVSDYFAGYNLKYEEDYRGKHYSMYKAGYMDAYHSEEGFNHEA